MKARRLLLNALVALAASCAPNNDRTVPTQFYNDQRSLRDIIASCGPNIASIPRSEYSRLLIISANSPNTAMMTHLIIEPDGNELYTKSTLYVEGKQPITISTLNLEGSQSIMWLQLMTSPSGQKYFMR